MEEFTQIATVVLGALCSITSITLFCYFVRAKHGIARAVAFMLGGEAICMLATTFFAVSSVAHMFSGENVEAWNSLSPETATALRWLMFVATFASTIHLAIQVDRLVRKREIENH